MPLLRQTIRCVLTLLLFGSGSFCLSQPAWAEDPDLEARVQALEQQNQRLLDLLSNSETTAAFQTVSGTGVCTVPSSPDCLPESGCDATGKSADGKGKDDPLSMSAKWKHGLEIETKDKKFRVHVGGRTQFDGVWLQNNREAFIGAGGDGPADAVDFRRARLRVDGTMYGFIDWAVEYDFVNSVNDNVGVQPATETNVINVPAPTDLWVNFKDVPWIGNLTMGNFKEPIGMEHATSSRFLDFMERSFNQDAFTGPFNNGFTPGIMAWQNFDDDRGLVQSGFFKNTTNVFGYGIGDGEYAWTSRLAYLPWRECEGAKLLHVAVAGSIRDPNNDTVQYRSRASLRNGPGAINPVMVNTGGFQASQARMLGGEAALQLNSLLVQAEYIGTWNTDAFGNGVTSPLAPLGTVFVNGWYVESLYFLTGEHREYEAKRGAFGRVIPRENFSFRKGLGAWQLGVRYSRLDLKNGLMDGGLVQDVTLGVNWFLNPNMKLQGNYVFTDREAPASAGSPGGSFNGYGMRLAYDF
ncbi:OprO/OprP family phosphate-selective porin [Planctomicrobium piriforme]|nr:porin [Planctomicrobium piriforme]